MPKAYHTKTATTIQYEAWLVFDENGGLRLQRAKPSIKPTERIASFQMQVPRSLWSKPELQVFVTLKPGEKSDGVAKAAAEALEGSGLLVSIAPAGSIVLSPSD